MKNRYFGRSVWLVVLAIGLGACQADDFGLGDLPNSIFGDGSGDVYQAEDRSDQSDCSAKSNHTGFSGSGFMDFGGNGTWIEWNDIDVAMAGDYTLTFRYANGRSTGRQSAAIVNGQDRGNVAFAGTGSWTTWGTDTITVSLREGPNTIRIQANTSSGGPNLDAMEVSADDLCPGDPNKTEPGDCGCGVPEGDCDVVAGNGLKGTYFNTMDFSGERLDRVDPTIDFDWGTGSPDADIDSNTFSVRWTGYVEAKYSETYTFYTVSDDGIRLWVDAHLIIDNWTNHGPTENRGTIALDPGTRYAIKMEYYENGGGAVAKLLWSSPNQAKQVVPESQLFTEKGEGETDNVALGKSTSQSSTNHGGVSSRAVDGNTSGNWGDGSITHTARTAAPWWRVDLGGAHHLEGVTLFNRTNCCSDRLSNFHVDLLDEKDNVIASRDYPGQAEPKTEIDISAEGVYAVRVQLYGKNYLSLAEVQVYGTKSTGGPRTCAEASERQTATLSCSSGETIANIDFASYGLPTGSCDSGFDAADCHASSSKSTVESACLGKQSCTVAASNGTFGDPCSGQHKRIAIVYTCSGENNDWCPDDPEKTMPGICGCGTSDIDSDGDSTADCEDGCPSDPEKTQPGVCGCGIAKGSCYWESEMVYYGDEDFLQYEIDDEGNRIPDFSYVGYEYGADLPNVPVVHTISPITGDNTGHIQGAIDYVAKNFQKNNQGIRGALRLAPGVYETDDIIYISYDGVVVRGSGRGDDPSRDTIIRSTRTGVDETVFRMGISSSSPSTNWNARVSGSVVSITDSIVPIGERTLQVSSSSRFRVGDLVVIRQNCNNAWFEAVDNGGTVNDPGWIERGFKREISFTRYITHINGRAITVDAPLYHRLNKDHGELQIFEYDPSNARDAVIYNIGIENLRIDIVTAGENDLQHTETAIDILGVIDGWVKEVDMLHFSEEAIQVRRSLRITAENCVGGPPVAPIEGGRRSVYAVSGGGQQILFKDCTAIAARHGFVLNGSTRSSGVVVLRGELAENISGSEGGHQQWSMGVLFDNCKVTSTLTGKPAFLLANRGDWGTSHGWSAANSVIWNTDTTAGGGIVVQKPPTAQNYAIGCSGTVNNWWHFPGPWGFTEGTDQGANLNPPSLYDAQMADRK